MSSIAKSCHHGTMARGHLSSYHHSSLRAGYGSNDVGHVHLVRYELTGASVRIAYTALLGPLHRQSITVHLLCARRIACNRFKPRCPSTQCYNPLHSQMLCSELGRLSFISSRAMPWTPPIRLESL